MELKDRLLELKAERGLTTDDLAARSGIPKGTINKLLRGETRNPTAQTLRRLADALGCSLERLCDRPEPLPTFARTITEAGTLLPARRKKMPLLGAIAAGKPILCQEEAEVADCDDDLRCDFALRVQGDSMIGARIQDGDLAFIRRQDDVDDGEIAAVIVEDRATLKRVYHIPHGLELLSENPKYPPMRFTLEEYDSIRILGKAVAFQSRIR